MHGDNEGRFGGALLHFFFVLVLFTNGREGFCSPRVTRVGQVSNKTFHSGPYESALSTSGL